MNIEKLQTKRNALTAQREQHMANINATIGAIAMVDELLQEAVADQVRGPSGPGEGISGCAESEA